MSKIICDICGTTYQETAECCPICGCARGAGEDLLNEDILAEETVEETAEKPAKSVFKKKKPIFDYDEVNTKPVDDVSEVEVEEDPYEEDEEDEEAPRHNTFVVIILTVLIAALLAAAGFIFVRYFLPNIRGEEEVVPETTVAQVEESVAETELRIPCDTIILNSSKQAELNQPGFSHLINVVVSPEDTTDVLSFVSADQSVATVSEDGKITAVGEGETIVTISCGDFQMYVNVVCDFTQETEPTVEETTAVTEGEEITDETTGDAVEETTAETEAATEATEDAAKKEVDPSIKLKLKKTDITLGLYYQFRLELDCNLDPKDVEWSSEHAYIAKVDEEGVITAMKKGTTDIIAKYGDQEVRCKVRIS